MGARRQALLELQSIELQIVDIRRQLALKERSVAVHQKKLQALQAALAAERAEVKRSQSEFDAVDLDLKARSAHIDKLRAHLNTVKTNKEYAAVLSQLNTDKAEASRVETRALEMMSAMEARRAALAVREKEEQAELRRLEDLQQQLEQTRHSLMPRINELVEQRKAAAAAVDAQTLSLFERLSERYEGEAMAAVAKVSPRSTEYICSGCNMSLRPDVSNALVTRDEVVTCKSCGRILYMT